jgi:hypothetical protein
MLKILYFLAFLFCIFTQTFELREVATSPNNRDQTITFRLSLIPDTTILSTDVLKLTSPLGLAGLTTGTLQIPSPTCSGNPTTYTATFTAIDASNYYIAF